jgi:hypothetical protein
MFKRDPNKQYVDPVVKVLGKGGPSRMWSPVATSGAKMPNCDVGFGDLGGFTGSFVCQQCDSKADAVYRIPSGAWICGPCRSPRSEKALEEEATAA